jgi:release factor glutamine methyltransferase
LAHVLGVERLALYTDHDRPLAAGELERYRAAVRRRGGREPIAYIVGQRAFRGLDLRVTSDVLVPRPETEHLVEWAVEVAPQGGAVLDWGTGSGAVALAIAQERPDLVVTAVERSETALAIARANGQAQRLQVEWLVSDGLAAVSDRRFDVIAANPPYLSEADLAAAPPELAFEPLGALVAGPTGYEALEALAAGAPAHLQPAGWLIAEVGEGQAARVEDLWRAAGLSDITSRPDLSGITRVVAGRRVVE